MRDTVCRFLLLGASAMLLVAPAAGVSVQRCVDAAGHVEYRDAACDPGATMDVIDVQPNTVHEIDQRAALAAEAALSMRLAMRMQAQSFERPMPPAYAEPIASSAAEPDYYPAWGYATSRRPKAHRHAHDKPAKRDGHPSVIEERVSHRH